MKKTLGISVILLLLAVSCSTRKNKFINRKYHNLTTKYNVLYNGNLALEKGIEDLNTKYEDDFWKLLPIEPLQIEEDIDILLPGKDNKKTSSPFDIAEEKAVKAVQKHSMNIYGKEHNKQIDDAYFLLGKSRYYSQRFVPALEAFEYVIKHYPSGDLNKDLRVWRAKTQVRLQNEEEAIQSLKILLRNPKLDSYIKEEAHTTLAMAYLALDSVEQAKKALIKATLSHENKEQYARNLFILGQLYSKENILDSSLTAFQQIIDFRKTPFKYKIHSYIEQVKNSTDSTDFSPLRKKFKQLLNNRENRIYFDELLYQVAQMDFKEGKEKEALENLNQSIHTPLAKDFQKGLAYETIGNYYFDKADFVKAGSYYDSVIPTVENPNTKRIRRLNRKRKSLEEVILYENTLKRNDSILDLVAMSDDEQKEFFQSYIEKLKKADEIAAILKENANSNNTGSSTQNLGNLQNTQSGKWYFYNTQTVNFGKGDFQKIWGNRKLQDNWRLSDKSSIQSNDSDEQEETLITTIDDSKKYDLDYYISKIPKDTTTIQKLQVQNSNSLYQLGLIYKERFKEYPLSITKLERFLSEKPIEKFILPAKYHLYKMYDKLGDSKVDNIKSEILSEYPDSRYSQLIQNPQEALYNDEETPESHYEKVFCDYEYEKYNEVIKACEKAIAQYEDEPIQAKFELLKSYCYLKLRDKESFKKGLEYVIVNHPKTEESEKAQELLDIMNGTKKSENTDNTKEKKDIHNKKSTKILTKEEKKKKVLELMKKKKSPKLQDNEKAKSN